MLKSAHRDNEESSLEEHDSPKKVFREMWFFLHKSITLDLQRKSLVNYIQSNGGLVQPNDRDVDVVLVGKGCNKDRIQLAYSSHSNPAKQNIRVEPMSFVSKCLSEGVVRYSSGMGGSRPRVAFTDEDDKKLARYLAIRMPDNSIGRRRDAVYEDLYSVHIEDPQEYTWVTRHTWRSWRNRYKKNVTRFDDMIDSYVKSEKPEHKQAYRLKLNKGWQSTDKSGEEDEEQSGIPSKRHHVDYSPDPPENRAQIRCSLTGKGKVRTVSEGSSDMHREPSPFYEDLPVDEPRPSKTLRTPLITYAHKSRHVSPPYGPEHYTSQATLVRTNHQMQEPRSRKSTVSDSPSEYHNVEVQQDGSPLLTKEPNSLTEAISSARAGPGMKTPPKHRLLARKTAHQDKPPPPESAVIVSSVPSCRDIRSRPQFVKSSIWSSKTRRNGTIAGTKASPVKKNTEMEETPYRPPVGTRAALQSMEEQYM